MLHKVAQCAAQVNNQHRAENHKNLIKINAARSGEFLHQTAVQLRGGIAQNLRSHHTEDGRADGKQRHQQHGIFIVADIANQLADGAFEIFGLFAGRSRRSAHTSHGTPARGLLYDFFFPFFVHAYPSNPNSLALS